MRTPGFLLPELPGDHLLGFSLRKELRPSGSSSSKTQGSYFPSECGLCQRESLLRLGEDLCLKKLSSYQCPTEAPHPVIKSISGGFPW